MTAELPRFLYTERDYKQKLNIITSRCLYLLQTREKKRDYRACDSTVMIVDKNFKFVIVIVCETVSVICENECALNAGALYYRGVVESAIGVLLKI